jgi:hypothetical protein
MIDADGGRCTVNFLFRGSDGERYAGTAGHCTLEGNGEITYRSGSGPAVEHPGGDRIGEIAYAILGSERDFALIRLDEGVKAKAQMCFFGGPTGWYRDRSPDAVALNYYGNGTAIGNASVVDQPVAPARTAIASNTLDPDVVSAWGVTTPGDSGAGVVDESSKEAVGVLVGIDSDGLLITRIGPQVAGAERALGVTLTLRTAPSL